MAFSSVQGLGIAFRCTDFGIKLGGRVWWPNGIKGQSPAGHKLVSIWGGMQVVRYIEGVTQYTCMQAVWRSSSTLNWMQRREQQTVPWPDKNLEAG